MEGPEIKAVEAVIDNGSFGKRTLRFETGRLAQQADGAVAAYLDDDSMILSTTTAGSSPKENYDFFPLTVDVEEKMYAAGKIPGSFFRREGRPSSEAILACRIIDRPLRPLFPHTLRNEVQVVETVLAVNPDDAYDVIALNAASASAFEILLEIREQVHSRNARSSPAVQLMQMNLQNPYPIPEIARKLDLSREKFNAVFREQFQQSPQQYKTRLRMRIAEQLLRHTGQTVKQIAFQTGYHSLSRFATAFRKYHGMSPRDYRKAGSEVTDLPD